MVSMEPKVRATRKKECAGAPVTVVHHPFPCSTKCTVTVTCRPGTGGGLSLGNMGVGWGLTAGAQCSVVLTNWYA